MSAIMKFIEVALSKLNKTNKEAISDFSFKREEGCSASELGCARKTVEDLKNPPDFSLDQLRILERGHVYEVIFERYLIAMGYKQVAPTDFASAPAPCFVGGTGKQMTLEHPTLQVGAHLDFAVKHRGGKIAVIECKSSTGIPSAPYGNHVEQLLLQIGLLQIKMPTAEISGTIMYRDITQGKEKPFDGYSHNEITFDYLLKKALHVSLAKQGKVEPSTSKTFLCGVCCHREGCTAFTNTSAIPAHILDIAESLEILQTQAKQLEKEIKVKKASLLQFTGNSYRGETDGISLTASTIADSTELNASAVESNHPEAFAACQKSALDAAKLKEQFPEVYDACQEVSRNGYTKVEVSKIKAKPVKKAALAKAA